MAEQMCDLDCELQGEEACGKHYINNGGICGNRLSNGEVCGHLEGCHSQPSAAPMVSLPVHVAEYFAEIGRLMLANLKHQNGDSIEKARKFQAEMDSAIASTAPHTSGEAG
jgi:hypothetical protein